jgi:putative RNA 2'-phosphotransferase
MTSPALIERITRSLAYMLRHQPEEFDLELDAHGYGDVAQVVQALNERLGEPVEVSDLDYAIRSGDRPRYEILGTRVRALYGHSIDVEPGDPTRPPELLFVGISARDADRAMRYGLRGGRRRFLHLALSADDAKEGGRRTGLQYVVITVYALDAWEEGINFYDRKALFLAEQIPTEFREVGEVCHDGMEPETRAPQDRQAQGGRRRGGHDRPPQRQFQAPRRAPAPNENFEEEGFGEGTPEAIQVDRQRAQAPRQGSRDDSQRPREPQGEHGRGQRGGRGRGDRNPTQGGGDRGREPQRAPAWNDAPPTEAAGAGREGQFQGRERGDRPQPAHHDRERNPRWQEREPREGAGGREPGFGDRPNERQDRGPRQSEFAERAPDRGGRQPEFNERAPDRGPRGERHGGGHDRGHGRADRDAPHSPAQFERGDRPAERQERAPLRAEPAPAAAPRVEPKRDDGAGFGLGIFEEPKPSARSAAAPARAATPPPPPAPAPAAPRENDTADGFGAGV